MAKEDKKAKVPETDPVPQKELIAEEMSSTDEAKIVQTCLSRLSISRAMDENNRMHWNVYENMWLGSQYSEGKPTTQYTYNSDGKRIMIRQMDEALRDDMPKRTVNVIFPKTQAEQAILSELNPTIRSYPFSDKQAEKARKQNLFNDKIFGKQAREEYLRANLDAILFDRGFLKIAIKGDVKPGEIPFSVKADSAKQIWADPNADRWEDVQWVIHEIRRYAYEVKERYPDTFDWSGGTTEIVSYYEFFIREGEDEWRQYTIYGAKLLKARKTPYPVNLYEVFKLYSRVKGWNGISEVQNWMEYQKLINKRASQLDWHISMMIDPPIEVVKNRVDADQISKLPLSPGKHYATLEHGAIHPIQSDLVNEGTFFNSIQAAEGWMEDIAGIPKAVMGRNEQGVYSAKHFSAIQEAAYVRVRLKEFFLKKALESLARKIYKLCEIYLADGAGFKIYDPKVGEMIELKAEDFNLDDTDIQLETTEANLIDPSNRLQKMIELLQYVGDKWDVREFFRAIEQTYPGFLGYDFMEGIEKSYQNPPPQQGTQPPAPAPNPNQGASQPEGGSPPGDGASSGEGGAPPPSGSEGTPIQDTINALSMKMKEKGIPDDKIRSELLSIYKDAVSKMRTADPKEIAAEINRQGEALIGGK